jgi:hypothetical protein
VKLSRYIAVQEAHHRQVSIQDEFRAVERSCEITFDEQHLRH